MTREEAIYRLKNMAWLYGSAEREQNIEAIDMAIEALSESNVHNLHSGDLISREDAVNAICKHSCYTEYGLCSNVGFPRTACGYVGAIQLLPSADAVSVVRCKDCRWWNSETNGCKRNPSVEACYETDFCKYGERRKP